MSLISVTNLTFAYDGSYDNIFDDVSFQIDTDWKLGLTGRNGRGKTTFLNLLMGKHEYGGKISASVKFQYFPQDIRDNGLTTSAMIEEMSPSYQEWEFLRELSLLSVSGDVLARPFRTLSNGEQTKAMLAGLFLGANNFLLIDEPTNHLDAVGREIVSRYLKSKSGFILVSHDRAFLDGCINHILSINRASIEVQHGNFSSWLANKERQDNFEIAENEKLKKDINRLKTAARQSGEWADKVESTKIGRGSASVEKNIDSRAYIGEKSRHMQQRRKNLEKRQQASINEKLGLLKNVERSESLKITQITYFKQQYLSLTQVGIYFGERNICNNINFVIERGDRIALQGKNGSGKSSLLKLICGEAVPHTGEIVIGSGLQISYVSQDTSYLRGDLSDYALQNNIDESLFKSILRKLDFSRVQFEKDMRDFSGGQKKKVLLARSLCEKVHLLIWDEPLNFIDIISRIQIEEMLLQFEPTILFVEHDCVFMKKIATKEIML